jgi:hypothetical protein
MRDGKLHGALGCQGVVLWRSIFPEQAPEGACVSAALKCPKAQSSAATSSASPRQYDPGD